MTSVDFIIEELIKLHAEFPESNIRYEFKPLSKVHIIEILPLEFFSNNELYMAHELNLEEKFFDLYPLEELIFVSEDSLNKVLSPVFETCSEQSGGFRSQFTESKDFASYFNFIENDYQSSGKNNYALAA